MTTDSNMAFDISLTPLKLKAKIGYGVGDLASNLTWQLTKLYLLYFYTDVFGISAAEAGFIFLISRIWDAVNDPMMGYIADHTKSRWGRFRPYLLFGSIPLGIILTLTFYTPALGSTGKFIYALITYLLLCTLYTVVNLPYSTLSAVISQDSKERGTLSGFRIFFAVIAGFIVAVLTKPIVGLFPSEQQGFQYTVLIFAVIATLLFWVCFTATEEQVKAVEKQKYAVKDITSLLWANKPVIFLSSCVFFLGISGTMVAATSLYFLKYNLLREDLQPVFMLVYITSILIGTIVSTLYSYRIGKKNMVLIGIGLFIVADIAIFVTPYTYLITIFFFSGISGVGSGFIAQLMWSMAPDTVDYGEWKTGTRADGVTFSAFSFMQKLDGAIGGALAGFVLSLAGYIPNVTQSQTTLNAILGIMTIAPIITGIIGAICIKYYKIDSDMFKQILADLEDRKGVE